jgi:phosphate starvation-inducible PhoH-like protein
MIDRNAQGLPIYPKTLKQIEYVDTLSKKDMTFGIGPAGTGKTYLAVVYAVSLLKKGVVKRIILTRPAIEAGESLGFLPGDLKEKVDPYLRPLYDALYDMLGVETVNNYIEKGVIEIAPLAYMRGRTLENAFCILDEAQNTTEMQMKMFLTRMGFNSKMVITGDVSQIDLPVGKKSGLVNALNLLKNIKQIGVTKFEKEDVVRHPLVQKILEAYDRD